MERPAPSLSGLRALEAVFVRPDAPEEVGDLRRLLKRLGAAVPASPPRWA